MDTSPPSDMPWAMRATSRRIGASQPTAGVRREDRDDQRAAGHQHDGQQHRLLAALEVGVAAQQEATERAEEEGEGVGGERADEGQRLVLRGEDLGGEVDREGGVDGPVVPLDGVADAGGDEGADRQLVRCLCAVVAGRRTRGLAGVQFLMAGQRRIPPR